MKEQAKWLLERTFERVVIVPEVEDETAVQGKAQGYAVRSGLNSRFGLESWSSLLQPLQKSAWQLP